MIPESINKRINEKLRPPQEMSVKKVIFSVKIYVVASPTASGKTLIAEMAGINNLEKNKGKILYIAPLKSLASEKYQKFSEKYPEFRTAISVGDYDFVGKALLDIGVEQLFYKVKQKPGKPLFFGKKGNTFVFALPGNPASALSCFYVYVNTALQRLSGNKHFELLKTTAKSTSSFNKKGDRAQFLKAIYNNDTVEILEGQNSSMIHTFALANALVSVPENLHEINIDDTVDVILLPIN